MGPIPQLLILLLFLSPFAANASEPWKIDSLRHHRVATNRTVEFVVGNERAKLKTWGFRPYIGTELTVERTVAAGSMRLVAHFYNPRGEKMATVAPACALKGTRQAVLPLPVFFQPQERYRLCFPLPTALDKQAEGWQVLVVVGDEHGCVVQGYPERGLWRELPFPERELWANAKPRERGVVMDPLIEKIIETGHPAHPQITLFARPPFGMSDATKARGVLALCLLASSVDGIKRQLQAAELKGGGEQGTDLKGMLRYADQQKLVVLCWGAKPLWDKTKNWDEMPPAERALMNEGLDKVAAAWAEGAESLAKAYGFPRRNYLLWGISASAQYALRLALRKPEYFLAVHAQIPSSFDAPTRGGRQVMWCLTTGELEGGYERSKRFYQECRAMGYAMVYKAIIGAGHRTHPHAIELGQQFFTYALTQQGERESLREQKDRGDEQKRDGELDVLFSGFQAPAFVGDMVNQHLVSASEAEQVPQAFRVPLPTRELAEVWNRKP